MHKKVLGPALLYPCSTESVGINTTLLQYIIIEGQAMMIHNMI